MRSTSEQGQFYQKDLEEWGFTPAEIEGQIQKDIQAAVKEVEKHLFHSGPILIRWTLAALNGKSAPHGSICQEMLDFQLKYIGDILRWYPEGFHGRIIEAIYKDLPAYEIEFNEEEEAQRLTDEWVAFLNGKTNDEVKVMIAQLKASLDAGR